jgi:hypothetical protein
MSKSIQRRHCSKCGEDLGFSESDPCAKCGSEPQQQEGPERTWRSDKAHEVICDVAERIANQYCSEDDTYNLEVKRLTLAISEVVDDAALPRATAEAEDALVDEVQHRMDQVVEAAVEWHQSDEDWFEKSEVLASAIDSLLALRRSFKSRGHE